jgi:hypothetical protein
VTAQLEKLQIRSVRQLVVGMNDDYLPKNISDYYPWIENQKIIDTDNIIQTMDLDMEDLSRYTINQIDTKYVSESAITSTCRGTYEGIAEDNKSEHYRKILNLSRPIFGNLCGEIKNLDFEGQRSNIINMINYRNPGVHSSVNNIIVNNANVDHASGATGLIVNLVYYSTQIQDIIVRNSVSESGVSGIAGSLIQMGPDSKISDITLTNDNISNYGITASDNSISISDISISYCLIGANEICNYNFGSITNVLEDNSTIKGYGICYINKASISDIKKTNAKITKSSICYSNDGGTIGKTGEGAILISNSSIGGSGVSDVNSNEISYITFDK